MKLMKNTLITAYWLTTVALFIFALVLVFTWTPTESTMGDVQKIFYLHFPVAINTFLACLVNFIASLAYLWTRRRKYDDLAVASATVGVLLCTIVLMTGMIWGKSAWGEWWTWSPRLTFSLLLWLLYASYLMVRPSIESTTRRALVAAVYGVVAFLDVPLVWLSVRLMPDIHPNTIALEPKMWLTVAAFALPVTMLSFGLIFSRYALYRRENDRVEARQQEEEFNETADAAATLYHQGGLTS
ncbi:cytochrome c biogenesis protein CcsA [Planctomycetales bacterium ZRK34]|nr:cytochrome c biogenesis protein CcsA [Planctomycetales bacterium ZRK34]